MRGGNDEQPKYMALLEICSSWWFHSNGIPTKMAVMVSSASCDSRLQVWVWNVSPSVKCWAEYLLFSQLQAASPLTSVSTRVALEAVPCSLGNILLGGVRRWWFCTSALLFQLMSPKYILGKCKWRICYWGAFGIYKPQRVGSEARGLLLL